MFRKHSIGDETTGWTSSWLGLYRSKQAIYYLMNIYDWFVNYIYVLTLEMSRHYMGIVILIFLVHIYRSVLNIILLSKLVIAMNKSIMYAISQVQCGAVITQSNFTQILHKTLHSLPVRARYGMSFVGSFILCPSHGSDVYNIMLYWTALWRHSTVLWLKMLS